MVIYGVYPNKVQHVPQDLTAFNRCQRFRFCVLGPKYGPN